MTLFQPSEGYCYNSDTLFLYDFISSFTPKGEILEVGGGCGVLGLLLKRDLTITLTFIEKQSVMADFIKKNAQENCLDVDIITDDFLHHNFTKRYDVIISNPPFYPSHNKKSENEIKSIARYDENLPMEKFFTKTERLLKERGEFIFCYEAERFDHIIRTLPKHMKITDVRFVYPKKEKPATLVMIRIRKHAKSPITFHPSLYVFDDQEFTQEAKHIYKKAATRSVKC